jgi:putative glycosyltransferase (TIGR04372 family)
MQKHHFKEYVCLVVRDSAYDIKVGRSEADIKFQSQRHTNIHEFHSCIRYLNSVGFFVLRMGLDIFPMKPNTKLGYAEFTEIAWPYQPSLDFEVFRECAFVISTGSGPDNIGLFFRKMILYVNVHPISSVPQTHLCPVALQPNYKNEDSAEIITVKDPRYQFLANLGTADLNRLGFSIIPKGGSELLKVTRLFVENNFRNMKE